MTKRFPVIVEKIDKNGSKHILDCNCPKCGGTGYIPGYEYIDGARCWKCDATGNYPHRYIERTNEYERVLAERRMAKERAKNLARRSEFLEKNGFDTNGVTHVVVGKAFDKKDELKALGAKFNPYIKWHLPFKPEGFVTVEMNVQECFNESGTAQLMWNENAWELVEKKAPVVERPQLNYVGTIGEKVTLELTQVSCFTFESQFGTSYINVFKDSDGNKLVWKTGCRVANDGASVTLKGTIKEHNEFREEKQTVLTRCRAL